MEKEEKSFRAPAQNKKENAAVAKLNKDRVAFCLARDTARAKIAGLMLEAYQRIPRRSLKEHRLAAKRMREEVDITFRLG